jgi:hypothetical protein
MERIHAPSDRWLEPPEPVYECAECAQPIYDERDFSPDFDGVCKWCVQESERFWKCPNCREVYRKADVPTHLLECDGFPDPSKAWT